MAWPPGVAPSGQQVANPLSAMPPPMPVATRGSATTAAALPEPPLGEQFVGFARLHADGVLPDEEFAAVKRRVLGI